MTLLSAPARSVRLLDLITPHSRPVVRREWSIVDVREFRCRVGECSGIRQIDVLHDTSNPESSVAVFAIAMDGPVQAYVVRQAGRQDVTFVGRSADGRDVRVTISGLTVGNMKINRSRPGGLTLLAGEYESVKLKSPYGED